VAWLRDKLNQSRLYVGYRKLLFAVLNRNFVDRIAVPPDDTRANLDGIREVADRLGARLLLVSEAVATADDRPRMAPYEQVMREFADGRNTVHYVAGQTWIDAANRTDLFEDLVHPTAAGARIIARGMHDTLDQLGWIGATPTPAAP
jgi:lysophospholipase L1-like esterase